MLENGSAGNEEGEEEALARELDAALGTDDLATLQQVAPVPLRHGLGLGSRLGLALGLVLQ